MKTAKVFKQGNSQAVRLPKEFRLSEAEVEIRREGEAIVLLPRSATRWRHIRACLGKFKGELERRQPTRPDQRDW
jgi:antitoxin VapB